STQTTMCSGIWIATVTCSTMAAGSWSTITLGRRKRHHFERRLTHLCLRAGSFRLDITDGARGSASGSGDDFGDRCRQVRVSDLARNYFVLLRTKSIDNEPLHLESQHSFLLCSPRNLLHPRFQAAGRLSFNSRPRRFAPFVPCAI